MRVKWVMVILAVCLVAVASSPSAGTRRIAIYVNGRQVPADAILHNGRTYLPTRAVAEALGCSVHWDGVRKAVHIQQAAAGALGATSVPPALKQTPQDPVYITTSGEEYHRANCRLVSKMKLEITRGEALQRGYTPCEVCKP